MLIFYNHIIAEKQKLLQCKFDSNNTGKEIYLGYIYYKDGVKLDKPYLLTSTDFIEIDNPNEEPPYEIIDDDIYYIKGTTYAEIKTEIIKLHYSNDDQIAIMLNYQSDHDRYKEKYDIMQDWRSYAAEIAKKYTDQ